MLLVIHVLAALSGIGMSTYSFLSPSLSKIRFSYGLVMLTLASGTVIIIKNHLSILSVCLSGLLYIGFTVSGLVAASHRLAKQEKSSN
jgi:hypothetical protein